VRLIGWRWRDGRRISLMVWPSLWALAPHRRRSPTVDLAEDARLRGVPPGRLPGFIRGPSSRLGSWPSDS